jgi:hypothetical protein
MVVATQVSVIVAALAGLILLNVLGSPWARAGTTAPCERWVAPDGDDAGPGNAAAPWASLRHAAAHVPDAGCTVWFEPGVYDGRTRITRRFSAPTTFKAVDPYHAVLQHDSTVLQLSGAANVAVEGFWLRHAGPGSTGYVAIVDRATRGWAAHIAFRDNIFSDSYGLDLLKIHNGVRFAEVSGNMFFNQGDREQHLDINSVTDVVVEDNILFNDFEASDRPDTGATKHYIVVKDSNGADDGLLGSRRVLIHRNVFLNWQGGAESFINIGNDGKPYHEADGVRVANNLFLGNSTSFMDSAFAVRGARNVHFVHNTTVGDLPSKWYAYRVHLKDDNPPNEDIVFANNIWSDPTGTMAAEAATHRRGVARNNPRETVRLTHASNLYWNDGEDVPPGRILRPLVEDEARLVGDPGLETDHSSLEPPTWDGQEFRGGAATIRDAFVQLVETYGAIPQGSPAVDAADPSFTPADDILGQRRGAAPDIGAFEALDIPLASAGEPLDESEPTLRLLAVVLPSLLFAWWALRRRGAPTQRPKLRLVEMVEPELQPPRASSSREGDVLIDGGERR